MQQWGRPVSSVPSLGYESTLPEDPGALQWRSVTRLVATVALLWALVHLLSDGARLVSESGLLRIRWSNYNGSSTLALLDIAACWFGLGLATLVCITATWLIMLREHAVRMLVLATVLLELTRWVRGFIPFIAFYSGTRAAPRGVGSLAVDSQILGLVQLLGALLGQLLLPALIVGLLTRPALKAALRRQVHQLPPDIQLLAMSAVIAGVLSAVLKPAALLIRDLSPLQQVTYSRPYGITYLGDGLLSVWYPATRVVLWMCAVVMLIGALAVLARRPWGRTMLLWQARVGLLISGVDLVLCGLLLWVFHPNDRGYFVSIPTALMLVLLSLALDAWILLALGRHRGRELFRRPSTSPVAHAMPPA